MPAQGNALGFFSPKGCNMPAQGNALGVRQAQQNKP
jgi:hypothetical protein